MKKKLLLFDGHSMANRAFYGVPLLTNRDGLYTNAVYGFLNIMLSLIEKEKPDLLGVTFDLSTPTFRHQFSSDYKGNRKGMPQELRAQIPMIKKVLEAMHIYVIEKEGFEADDVLGTLAKAAEKENMEVTVVSGDRDLFQITSEHIEIKIPRTKKTGTEIESFFAKDVEAAYGVTPTAFIDVKGLMGDASDNIKGVPGIGEKTAVKLIKAYGSIENLLNHVEEIKQKKLRENLENYAQDAKDSKMLATIVCDVPLEYTWDAFKYDLCLDEAAYELFNELDLKTLLTRLPHQGKDRENEKLPEIKTCDLLALKTLLSLMEEKSVGISALVEEDIIYLGIALEENTLYYMEGSLQEEEQRAALQSFFESYKVKKLIHDSKKLKHELIDKQIHVNEVICDTFIGSYILEPTQKSYDLSDVSQRLLGRQMIESKEEILGKGKAQKKWKEIEANLRKVYFARASYTVLKLAPVIEEEIKAQNMSQLFDEIEMPLIDVLFDMEYAGMRVDPKRLRSYGEELEELLNQISEGIYEEAGESFNINSPKQLGVILFEKMKIPAVKKTKTGYSTAAEVLDTLKDQYEIVAKILEYRQYAKLKSTYVEGLLAVLTKDHKIHSTFNQTITATGRLSSTEPNLQNIPVKFEMGKRIREMFIPSEEGWIFLDGDYSQIELRVLAHMAEDEKLIDAFKNNIDIHTLTASEVFHVPLEEVTPLQRSHAKAVNFGIVYGISAFSLAEDIKTSQKEAQRYIEGYFERYPAIKAYLDHTVDFAMQKGYVETLYHRKRDIPEILASHYNLREFGKRVAMNTPIQGTSADIIKIAMVKVHRRLKKENLKARLVLTVHDELLIESPKEEAQKVKALLKEEMEGAVQLRVPLKVDVHEGRNWLEVK